mgnify:CR=1 FL=1
MPNLKGTKVSFQHDIYSLGVSLAYLQRYFGKAMSQVEKFDSKKPTYKEDWDKIVEDAVKSVISMTKGFETFEEAFLKAVKVNTDAPFKTMEEFCEVLVDKFITVEGADKVIEELASSGKTFDVNSHTPSFWKYTLLTKTKGPQPSSNETRKNGPPQRLPWVSKSSGTTPSNNQNQVFV